MAYNKQLAERVRNLLDGEEGISEKHMFGGLSFLKNGKMACGVLKDNLVVRVNPENSAELLKKPHVRPMDFTGKPMKGFLYVSEEGYKTESILKRWIQLGIEYATTLSK